MNLTSKLRRIQHKGLDRTEGSTDHHLCVPECTSSEERALRNAEQHTTSQGRQVSQVDHCPVQIECSKEAGLAPKAPERTPERNILNLQTMQHCFGLYDLISTAQSYTELDPAQVKVFSVIH